MMNTSTNVILLTKFRKSGPPPKPAGRSSRSSMIHIEIDANGDSDPTPYEIQPEHALELLSMCTALSQHLLDVHARYEDSKK